MSRDADEIRDLYTAREKWYRPVHEAMEKIRRVYDGEAELHIKELEREEGASVPNLLAQGVDQMAGRIASSTPYATFASQKPGQRASDRRADTARNTVQGWWEADRHAIKRRIRSKYLIAFGMGPAIVQYDFKRKRPTWVIRNPLESYPAIDMLPGESVPSDCIFAYERSVGWLTAHGYGPQIAAIRGHFPQDTSPDSNVRVIEYWDPDGVTTILTGVTPPQEDGTYVYGALATDAAVVLHHVPNEIGMMQVAIPSRLSLSRTGGQFDAMVGQYYTQARLMALEVEAIERGIFPDTFLVSYQGEEAKLLSGPYDGRSGLFNVVQGGTVQQMQVQPGYQTNGVIDRLERSQRITGGIPAELGGESGNNIRTGRRGDQVLSAVIDFPVGEAQEVLAYSLCEEDKVAIALSKRWDGDTPRTVYVGTGNATKVTTYVANQVFPVDDHVVAYPATGTDLNSLMIGIGQRIGIGMMSKKTAATLDPMISDAEYEHDAIQAEGIEQALLAGLQQQVTSGAMPPLVLAKIMTLVRSDRMELAEALNKVVEDAQKEQQAQQDAMAAQSPEAAMAPGAEASLTGSTIPGASQTQQSYSTLLTALRKPAMTIQPGRNIPQGGV